MNGIVRKIVGKYVLCVVFSFLLFVIVWLSEILRNIMLAVSSGWSSGIFVLMLYSVFIFFLFVFVLVPLCLLGMWFMNPKLMKAFFATFGVTEELLDKKKEKRRENQKTVTA